MSIMAVSFSKPVEVENNTESEMYSFEVLEYTNDKFVLKSSRNTVVSSYLEEAYDIGNNTIGIFIAVECKLVNGRRIPLFKDQIAAKVVFTNEFEYGLKLIKNCIHAAKSLLFHKDFGDELPTEL